MASRSSEVLSFVQDCSSKGLIKRPEAWALNHVILLESEPAVAEVAAAEVPPLTPLQQLDIMITDAYIDDKIDQNEFAHLTQLEQRLATTLKGQEAS